MHLSSCFQTVLGVLALLAPAAVFSAETQPDKLICGWTFGQPGDLQGWQPNGHLTGVKVAAGALVCRAVGADPILELRTPLRFAASPWQVVEIRLKTDRDGECELFWSNTGEGRFGGFTQEKTTRFKATGDRAWHTYRVAPFWHPEGQIVRLRFDVYDGATFAIESIRVLERTMPALARTPEWDFSTGSHGWQALAGSFSASATGLTATATGPDFWLLAPPVGIAAEDRSFVSVSLAVAAGHHGTVFFATKRKPGLHLFDFPILADGREHVYNLDLLAAREWQGQIIALGVRPSDAAGVETRISWLKVSPEPQGPPQLKVEALSLQEALPRAGRPARLTAILSNKGGQAATNLRTELRLPAGVVLLEPGTTEAGGLVSTNLRLGVDEQRVVNWAVQAPMPLRASLVLAVGADNAEAVTAAVPVEFTPRPQTPKAGYVPEPQPVRGPYEVGAYYFPGWKTASQWQPLRNFPERRPVLGWYREGDPEVADWQIKWAVEHGITFFAYDWYWSKGARQLEHGLHDGYFKARYRHLLKFCLLWANHNPAGSSSQEDCVAVTRYWIEHYFRQPEHLMVEGKPVVIIFSTDRFTSDLGSPGVKRAFEAMRAECGAAGLKGLYLIACVGSAGEARRCAEEGYDAVTAYNWPGLGMIGQGNRAPYDTLLEGYRRNWDHILEQSPIPILLPVSGGWDSRPWHGENNLVRFGRTSELFGQHLQAARALLDGRSGSAGRTGQEGRGAAGVLPLVLVEAWNEWGEGSYIEPHQEFGFGYLDAIRAVFTGAPKEHPDLAPADVGLGPYDLPTEPAAQSAWSFEKNDQGWANVMDLADVRVLNGALTGRTTGNDPAFFGPATQLPAGACPLVRVRLKLERADGQPFQDQAQLFWSTPRLPESESTSLHFPVLGDGQWHDYVLRMSENPRWRGVITRLRLDPCNRSGIRVSVQSIRCGN